MDNQLFLLLAARKLSGEATESDIEELEKFFDEDDVYRQKFEFFKTYWENRNSIGTDIDSAFKKILARVKFQEDKINENFTETSLTKEKTGTLRFVKIFSKVAAVLLLCIGSTYFIYIKSNPHFSPQTAHSSWIIKQNRKGTKSTIILADGTKVIINADSKLKYPLAFTGASREVYLAGEAFFDVTHNAKMPFVIHAGKMNIKVLGTEFNVKSYPEDSTSETTLIRGLIEVTLKDRPSDKIILRPKEKLIVSNEPSPKDISIAAASPVKDARLLISTLHYISSTDSAVVETSWVDNKLVFQDESFGNLAKDMERRYGVNIQFSNDTVKDYRFTGAFEKESINEALEALKLTETFNYKTDGENITIY